MKVIGTRVQQIDLVISANTDDYNVFTSAGSPTEIVALTLTVNSGIVVRDTDGVSGGINFGTGWIGGSSFKLVNNGGVRGLGGTGGNGATGYGVNGSPGTGGSEAIRLQGLNVIMLVVDYYA